MTSFETGNGIIQTTIGDDYVALIEMCSPPNNFFSMDLIGGIGDALERLDD